MVTKAEVINWAKNLANRGAGYDSDGAYGYQCVDIPNGASKRFFGKSLMGNGIDMLNAARGAGYKIETNGLPKAGAFFCMRVSSHPYGHTGIVIEDATSAGNIKTIEQNVDGGLGGGPARYRTRAISGYGMTIIGWFYPPYSDLNTSYKVSTTSGGTVTVVDKKYNEKALTYNRNTISATNVNLILRHAAIRNLLPSGLFSQLYLESHFGASSVARTDNNWAGFSGGGQTRPSGVIVTTGSARPANEGGTYMRYKIGASSVARTDNNWAGFSGGGQTRPSGVIVTTGSARPANEGGTYMRYKSTDDFFNDYTYTLYRSGGYKVAGAKTFDAYIKGLFRVGGSLYDYAAVGYYGYLPSMRSLRSGINNANGGILDEMDRDFINGNLIITVGVGSDDIEKGRVRDSSTMDFMFKIVNDPWWKAEDIYYYNGAINAIQTIHNSEEMKFMQSIYQETTGRPLQYYTWDSNVAPVQNRIFGTLQPGAPNSSIKRLLDDLIAQLNSEI